MQNTIYLKRKLKVIISKGESKLEKKWLATFLKNIESLGFTFSKKAIDVLQTYSVPELDAFYKKITKTLREMVGANVKFKPMYPDFPTQVMEMDEAELYFNAIIHYLTLELPQYEKSDRPELKEKIKYKVIELGTKEDFLNIFKNLLNAKVAVSPQDKEDIEWFIKQYRAEVVKYLPERIENKENLSYVIGLLKTNDVLTDEVLQKYFKTATDVLRLMVGLSEGDVSLSTVTRFKKFKRSDRKLFLRMLENCSSIAEDMLRFKNVWIRVGEILHPSEYQNRFPKTVKAFDAIRNNKEIKTFNNQFERFFTEKDTQKLLDIASKRPGEFARRLDRILRKFKKNHVTILREFAEISDKISSTVLLQVREYYKNRNKKEFRVFIPKGTLTKIRLEDNKLPEINEETCKEVVKICSKALIKQFKKKPALGKVYIDENLVNYPVPFALRSASKALRTLTRGSKIKMEEEGDTIRMFIYWKEPKGDRVDIDLSASLYNEDWEYMEHVSYTNLKSDRYQACHSGDITSAPNGASEFIDVDIPSAVKFKARYLVMNVFSFSQQPFVDLPMCFAGCMIRKQPKSGEIYEPKTVKYKFDLTSESKYTVPLIFDLLEKKIIWVDSAISERHRYGGWGGNNVESNQTGMVALGRAFTKLPKPNLYDLFSLHAKARGTIVSKSKAKTIFSQEEGITPYDIEKITSEYL